MKQMNLILSKSRSLVDTVDLITNTINDEEKIGLYKLRLTKATFEDRMVDLLAHSRRFEDYIVDTLEMRLYGRNDSSMPKYEEISYILNNFGGRTSRIEHETKRNTSAVQKIITNTLGPSLSMPCPWNKVSRDCLTFLDIKDRMNYDSSLLSINLHAAGKRTDATLTVNSNRQGGCSWETKLEEHRPKGPFARYRMSKLNNYFKRYVEPKILSPAVWSVEWY